MSHTQGVGQGLPLEKKTVKTEETAPESDSLGFDYCLTRTGWVTFRKLLNISEPFPQIESSTNNKDGLEN